jgi:hypothetical protein
MNNTTSISQIIGSIPKAQNAFNIIQQGQTIAENAIFTQATAALTFLNQLNQGQISGEEFQDLMLDVKNQVDANSAVQNIQFNQMLSESIGLFIFLSRQYSL